MTELTNDWVFFLLLAPDVDPPLGLIVAAAELDASLSFCFCLAASLLM